MMKTLLNKSIYNLAVLSALLSCSCTKDDVMKYSWGKDGSPRIILELPGMEKPGTYSIDAIRQNQIVTVDVLVFNVNGTKEEFDYHLFIDSDDIDEMTNTGYRKILNISLNPTPPGQLVRIVVVANVSDRIPASIPQGMEREDVMAMIKFDIPDGRWYVEDHNNYDVLPMWGMSDLVELSPERDLDPIKMIRALAKIDFYINRDPNRTAGRGLNNFRVDSLYIMNAAGEGHIAPSDDAYLPTQKRVIKATVPQPQVTVTNPAPIPMWHQNGSIVNHIIDDIFLAEIYKLVPGQEADATFLLLECTFEGEKTFYRIDFINYYNDQKVIMDILRNYRYSFNISNVHRKGYPTMAEAIAGMSSNNYLDIELDMVNESISTDGNYYLTTTQDEYRYMYLDAYPGNVLEVYTDDPMGWTAEVTESWIDVKTPLSGPQGLSQMIFDIDASATGREGKIIFRTHQMTQEVKIIHSYANVIPPDYLDYEIEVCTIEQPYGFSWYDYNNMEHNYITNEMEPPYPAIFQLDPPFHASCAAMDYGHHTDWRVPNEKEFRAIILHAATLPRDSQLTDFTIHGNLSFMTSSGGVWYPIAGGDFTLEEEFDYYNFHRYSRGYYSNYIIGYYSYTQEPAWNYGSYGKSTAVHIDGFNDDRYGRKRSAVRCVRGGEPYRNHVLKAADSGLGYDLHLARYDLIPTPNMSYKLMYNGTYTSRTANYFTYANLATSDYDGTGGKMNPVDPYSCDILNTGDGTDGFKNWRLPTFTELKALFDYVGTDQQKWVDYKLSMVFMTNPTYNNYYEYREDIRTDNREYYYHYFYRAGYISSTEPVSAEVPEILRPHHNTNQFIKGIGWETTVKKYQNENLNYPLIIEVGPPQEIVIGKTLNENVSFNETVNNIRYYYYWYMTSYPLARCVRTD